MHAVYSALDPTLAESRRLRRILEGQRNSIPTASRLIEAFQPMHADLERHHHVSETAVNTWRAALAQRWNAEVDGLRIFRQTVRQLAGRLGEHAPEIRLLTHAEAEAQGSATELLAALQQLQSTLELSVHSTERSEIVAAVRRLEGAINETRRCEDARRCAVSDRRLAQEAYHRLRTQIAGELAPHGVNLEKALRDERSPT